MKGAFPKERSRRALKVYFHYTGLFLLVILIYFNFYGFTNKRGSKSYIIDGTPNAIPASSFLLQRQNLPKVAVYSGNFGNYRNETNAGIDDIPFDSKIDYFFFIDNTTKIH